MKRHKTKTTTPDAPVAAPPRVPIGYATYRGDARDSVGEVLGPNDFKEWFVVLEATYDETSDTTRLGFAYARVMDVTAHNRKVGVALEARARMVELLTGAAVAATP